MADKDLLGRQVNVWARPKVEIAIPFVERMAGKVREKGKGYMRGNKRQITHTIIGELLDRVDAEAERYGESRATVINRFIRQGLERDGL